MRSVLLCCGIVLLAAGLAAAADPVPPGTEATPGQAAALDRTVEGLLTALRDKDRAAAEALIAVGDEWKAEDWLHLFVSAEKMQQVSSSPAIIQALAGRDLRVTEVKTWGDRGVGRVVVAFRPAVWLPLVQRDGQWRLEVPAVEQSRAERELAGQVDSFNNGDMLSIMLLMDAGGFGGPRDLLALAALAPEPVRHQITQHRVAGDRAFVWVEGQVETQFAVPVEHTRSGWRVASRAVFVPMRPDQPLSPALAQDRSGRVAQTCLANLKSLPFAMNKYVADHGAYPPAAEWSTAIFPGYLPNEQVLTCPAVSVTGGKWGYAMNFRLSRLDPKKVTQPESTVLFFDSSALQPNAYDKDKPAGASVTIPPRHDDVINYVFVDGHGASFRSPLGPEFFRPIRTGQQLLKLPPEVAPGGG